jgi:glycerol-3-phosphate acyltransferase PlsY
VKTTSVKQATPRAIFHATLGIIIVFSVYYLPRLSVLIALGICTIVFVGVDIVRFRRPALKAIFSKYLALFLRQKENGRLTGASYFLLGCLITVLAFPKEIAVAAILFLSLGDPAAALVKRWKGKIWFGTKSLEGNIACLVICLAVGAFIVIFLGKPVTGTVMAGAVFAALFQGIPVPVNDNLTIPIGSGLIMLGINVLLT